jgi:hypothetical protein
MGLGVECWRCAGSEVQSLYSKGPVSAAARSGRPQSPYLAPGASAKRWSRGGQSRHRRCLLRPTVNTMQLVSAIIGALGDALVAVTVYIAVRARQDARTAESKADEARGAFAEQQQMAQRETELVRRRQRVENVGEIIEKLFWALVPFADGPPAPAATWMPDRNRLAQLMIGLNEVLPSCASIMNAGTSEVALESAKHGRQEVTRELERIDGELRKLHSPVIPQAITSPPIAGLSEVK